MTIAKKTYQRDRKIQLSISIDESMRNKIIDDAQERNVSVSSIIRNALEKFYKVKTKK